jgi:hypothetical protein
MEDKRSQKFDHLRPRPLDPEQARDYDAGNELLEGIFKTYRLPKKGQDLAIPQSAIDHPAGAFDFFAPESAARMKKELKVEPTSDHSLEAESMGAASGPTGGSDKQTALVIADDTPKKSRRNAMSGSSVEVITLGDDFDDETSPSGAEDKRRLMHALQMQILWGPDFRDMKSMLHRSRMCEGGSTYSSHKIVNNWPIIGVAFNALCDNECTPEMHAEYRGRNFQKFKDYGQRGGRSYSNYSSAGFAHGENTERCTRAANVAF